MLQGRGCERQHRLHRYETIGHRDHFIGTALHVCQADGVLGVQAPSNGLRLEGHWASGRASGAFLSVGARTDVTAPAGATLPACFEHLFKALEALVSKTSDAWLGVNA